ncbi:MAG: MFS transporter [Chitinophaga sp.]|jgi:sugar porter (SP) family MFS transporter|nr:MFS transporter [Chitinophaga sp.]
MQKGRLFIYSIVAALAGFIFGFDTVVISGANLPIKQLWHTSPGFHGFFIMSMALWGTVVGALLGGIPTEVFGRKKVLLTVGILFFISAIGSALAQDPYTFSFFRFIGGLGIGISSVTVPTYISEISTSQTRGRLVGMYQFNIVFGILIAFISNYFLKGFDGKNDWRWMLGVLAIPSILYSSLVFILPESPRWLVLREKDYLKAKLNFIKIGVSDTQAEIDKIELFEKENISIKGENLFSRKYIKMVWLAFMVAFFNQLSGINFILYYAPEILESAGIGSKDSLFNSIAIGGVNLIFTFIGLYFIDKAGRKTLLIIGSIGYIISLCCVAASFKFTLNNTFLLSSLMGFIAAHAIGQGAVIWVFISEVFPNKIRATGQALGSSVHWIFAAIITLITPLFLDKEKGIFGKNPYPIFLFFALMMVLQIVWIVTKVPETKGKSLENISSQLLH